MRRTILLLLVIASPWFIFANDDGKGNNSGNDNKSIPIDNTSILTEERQLQVPIFHAEINTDRTILIRVDRPMDFEVKILDANGSYVHYRGETINDVLHITTQGFPEGNYTLYIETCECTYTGTFEIS